MCCQNLFRMTAEQHYYLSLGLDSRKVYCHRDCLIKLQFWMSLCQFVSSMLLFLIFTLSMSYIFWASIFIRVGIHSSFLSRCSFFSRPQNEIPLFGKYVFIIIIKRTLNARYYHSNEEYRVRCSIIQF